MKKSIILSLLIIFITISRFYAQKSVTNTLGENHTIHSKFLGEDRDISIYLPDNYQDSKQKYPVLYIVDGQRYFLNGVLYQKTLGWQEKSPDFIVVGINTDNSKRRKLFYEDSKTFIHFLEQELFPYIERNFRTSSERIYFGWEMAGGLAIEILAKPERIFSAYLIASPTHINTSRLDSLRERLITKKGVNEFIYFTLSPLETWSIESIKNLRDILKENTLEESNWEYKSLNGENHHSTPTKTIHEGLSKYFNDYPYLQFYSLKEFNKFGGINTLKNHYKERGEKYSLSTEIHKSTKHFLLLQSMKEENYKLFESFMKEFGDYYKSKTRDLWFNRYAQFYLKYENPDKALEIFNAGLNKFPNSSIILSGLGDTYLAKRKTHQAKQYYKMAIDLATKNGDSNLEDYKLKLKEL